MVWGSRQDRMGNLLDLWPLLPVEALGDDPQQQTSLVVDSHRSGCGSGRFRMADLSFPA
jgi:hypothetical protein